MATFTPTVTHPEPRIGGGGHGRTPRYPGGGGGGGRSGGDSTPDYGDRLRRYRLGVCIGLTSVVMLFVAFTSALIVRQGLGTWDYKTNTYQLDWKRIPLPTKLLVVNTLLLAVSSVTMELARRKAARDAALAPVVAMPGISAGRERNVPWLGVTVVLGLGFLAGQLLAWKELIRRGLTISATPSSSFFYVLTGTHGLHLAGGVIALLYAAATSLLHRPLETRRLVVDVTAWYWHFMGILWIYIFALLYLAG